MKKKQTRFVIGGIVIVAAVGLLIVAGLGGRGAATTYYLTVSELKTQGASERKVRVSGMVVESSIEWEAQDMLLRFEIADQGGVLPVVYHGPRPDMLRDEAEVVVEGQYAAEGTFEASNLLLKCPSRYEAAATATAVVE